MFEIPQAIYAKHGGLPKTLYLEQDNTCRECKNQKILKWCAMLVASDIFLSITLAYPVKGHTHYALDGTFGQLCVKLAARTFDDDEDIVEILNGFLKDLGVDAGSREGAVAYKLDEGASWDDWWDRLGP
jgi:hypothetical protein